MRFLVKVLHLMYFSASSSLPDWVSLNCDGDHQYFFSHQRLSWYDASDECNLYGGYLLAIDRTKLFGQVWEDGKSRSLVLASR